MRDNLGDSLRAVVRRAHVNASATSSTERPAEKEVCPLCRGAGYVRRDVPPGDPYFGRALPCQCSRQKLSQTRKDRLNESANLGKLSRMTFDNFNAEGYGLDPVRQRNLEHAYRATRAFAERPEGWLLLMGGYGVGKTHLAAAIANAQLDRETVPLFVVVPDLLDHLRATFSPTSEVGYDELFHRVRTSPLLILDDLGAQYSSPWAQEKLFQLFNHRYMARLPMVITLNSIENVEGRLLERMIEMKTIGMGSMIELRVPPYRGRGARPSNGFGPSDPSAPQPPIRRRK